MTRSRLKNKYNKNPNVENESLLCISFAKRKEKVIQQPRPKNI